MAKVPAAGDTEKQLWPRACMRSVGLQWSTLEMGSSRSATVY